MYQEARYMTAGQGLPCFVSGAPIQTNASGREGALGPSMTLARAWATRVVTVNGDSAHDHDSLSFCIGTPTEAPALLYCIGPPDT
jgi:hypothetical protein